MDVASEVYQFRIVLERVSPMVWRRILVRSDSSIVDLHYTLQIAMGWRDDRLHRLLIHGKEYGIYQPGGIHFNDNPANVRLSDFRFRLGEYFFYEYDFTSSLQLRIRLEKFLEENPRKVYPVCTGGNRTVPSEDSDPFVVNPESLIPQVAKLLSRFMEGEMLTDRDREKRRHFEEWMNQYRLNREIINHRPRQFAAGDEEWRWE